MDSLVKPNYVKDKSINVIRASKSTVARERRSQKKKIRMAEKKIEECLKKSSDKEKRGL